MRTLILAMLVMTGCALPSGSEYVDVPGDSFVYQSGIMVAPIAWHGDASIDMVHASVSCERDGHFLLCAWEAMDGQTLEECSRLAPCAASVVTHLYLETTFGITASYSTKIVIDSLGTTPVAIRAAGADLTIRHHVVTE